MSGLPCNVVPLFTRDYAKASGTKPETIRKILAARYPELCSEHVAPCAEKLYRRQIAGKGWRTLRRCLVVICKNRRTALRGAGRDIYFRTYHVKLLDGTWGVYKTLLDIDMDRMMPLTVQLCAVQSISNGRELYFANE